MNKNEIYMMQGTDYKEMAVSILRAAGISEEIGDKNRRIGVKPNIVGTIKPSEGATTHPELVDGVLSYLKNEGFSNVVVLEGAWIGDLTLKAAKYTGIYDVCQRHKVPFIDLQKDTYKAVDAKGMSISVCNEALKLDYLINMPVIKGHCQTVVTCAMKNCKGLIPNSEKRRFHTLGLHAPIAHLNTVIHQDFILADNICGDLDFEEGGNPVVMNRVLGFRDPVLCDSFAAECMGYSPEDVEYIRIAKKLGVGSTDVSLAKVISLNEGESEGILNSDKMHSGRQVARLAEYAAPVDACSACYGSLIHALKRLDERGELRGNPKKSIAIGQGYAGKTGKIGVGKCTKCFEKNLMGCPPKAVDIVDFLRKEWMKNQGR